MVTAHQLHLGSSFDEVHLLTATRRNAVLVTHNWEDFSMLHRAWQLWTTEWGIALTHAGILSVEQRVDLETAARELVTFLGSGHPLANRVHRWRRNGGWEHYPAHE